MSRVKMEWLKLCGRHAACLTRAAEERSRATQYPMGFDDQESQDMWRRRRIAEAKAEVFRARRERLGRRA